MDKEQIEKFKSPMEMEQIEKFKSHMETEQIEKFKSHMETEQIEKFKIHMETEQIEKFKSPMEMEQIEKFKSRMETEQIEKFKSHMETEKTEKLESFIEEEDVEKFKRYEIDCRKDLMSKYFSDKTIFGGNIFDVKMTEDGETTKASRFPGYQSYADPANFMDDSSSKSYSTSETPSHDPKGKQSSKRKYLS